MDDQLEAYHDLGESSNFPNDPETSHTHDDLFGDDPQPSATSSFSSAPVASRSSVSGMLRESMSRAASREHSQSIGHPHSLFGATPYSSPPVSSPMPRDVAATSAPWGQMSIPASAPRRTPEVEQQPEPEPEPEPFDFHSPTQLSTAEHLDVPHEDEDEDEEMEDGESDEPEVPETSLPSVMDPEEQEQVEDQEPMMFEDAGDIEQQEQEEEHEDLETTRDQLEYSARAASVILGDETRVVRREHIETFLESAADVDGHHPLQEVEQAIDDEDDLEQALEDAVEDDQVMEEPAEEEQLEPPTITQISTITTVERVPLKRSIDEMSPGDPVHTAKRRRRRSFAEMLEADAQRFIAGLSERSRRHTSVPASQAPETPSKKASQAQKSQTEQGTTTTPRGRGRPRKSDATPGATRGRSAAPTTPGRRGRPPKAAADRKSTSRPPPSTGRKRGRPSLASLAARDQGSPEATQAVAPPPSTGRRGRPRKYPVAAPAPASTNDATVETPQPKRRGRPPKQKPVVVEDIYDVPPTPVKQSNIVVDAPVEAIRLSGTPGRTVAAPRSRSRSVTAPSRGRTTAVYSRRASKSRTREIAPEAPRDESQTEAPEPQTEVIEPEVEIQVDEPEATPEAALETAPEVAPPKRRGRPPKAKRANPAAAPATEPVAAEDTTKKSSSSNEVAASAGTSEQVVRPDVPRRRGRPRKTKGNFRAS